MTLLIIMIIICSR